MPKSRVEEGLSASGVMSRNLAVLQALSCSFRMSLRDISEAAGLAKPTAHRVLLGLVRAGLVAKDGGVGQYRLTSSLAQLASRIDDRVLLLDAVAPAARAMTAEFLWPVALGLLERGRMVVYFSTRDMTTQTFRPSTLYETLALTSALGQAALCTMPQPQVARELDSLPEFARGSSARADLEGKLADARVRGFGLRPNGRGGTASIAIGLNMGSPRVGALVTTIFETMASPELIGRLASELQRAHAVAASNYQSLFRPRGA